jgi:hypothetical protein
MYLEAISVCYGYADFLQYTLPHNLQYFDRYVIVTHPKDTDTQRLCARFGVDCVQTEVFHEDGDKFNKGRAIQLGLSHLRHKGWLLHLDSDILLPHNVKGLLAHSQLDPANIYAADRMNCPNYESFMAHKHKLVPNHQWRYLVTPIAEWPVGARLLHTELHYQVIGYFQLWHASKRAGYPIVHGSAEHGDVLFSQQWTRKHRILLPEFWVTHLETGKGEFGANWQGRKTPRFGPETEFCKEPPNPQTAGPAAQEYTK